MASFKKDGGQYIPNSDRDTYEFISFWRAFNRVIQGRDKSASVRRSRRGPHRWSRLRR